MEEEEERKKTQIEKAEDVVARMEKANEERRLLLDREEELKANKILDGESEAGAIAPKPVEETPQEYAERVMGNKIK